jgi:hypothetical protein
VGIRKEGKEPRPEQAKGTFDTLLFVFFINKRTSEEEVPRNVIGRNWSIGRKSLEVAQIRVATGVQKPVRRGKREVQIAVGRIQFIWRCIERKDG